MCPTTTPTPSRTSRPSSTRPGSPSGFATINDARRFCGEFFEDYNSNHRHSGIGLHTPADVHYGRAETVRAERQAVLDAAYACRPDRFGTPPQARKIPKTVWINEPQQDTEPPTTD